MKLRAALLIACTSLAMSIAGCLPVLAATRHVVLLFDERVELPGLSLLDAELVNTLRSNSTTEPIEIYREVMDLFRFGPNAYKALLRDFFRTKYADKKIDLDELNDIVDDILQDDRRASEVIRRMRSLLRKTPFEPKNIDFNDLVRETIGFLSALAVARKVELASLIAPAPLPIVGDRIQLQQVIPNLVVNAIDAMSGTPGKNRIVSLRTSRVENFAELSISDRGPGIPAERLKDVFEPFFTTKAEGMGMGLSIARTLVEAHNGQISAVNAPEAGAVFRVRLPIARHAAAPATGAGLTGMPGGGTFTALFSHNACYARMNRNLVDCACKRAKVPESISTLSSR